MVGINDTYILIAFIIVVLVVAFALLSNTTRAVNPTRLTPQEREELLARVRHWLDAKTGKPGDIA